MLGKGELRSMQFNLVLATNAIYKLKCVVQIQTGQKHSAQT